MANSQKWKDKLLSSSFPLEFEAMRCLADKGFYVSSDFSYSRLDGGTQKDFSVDVEARAFTPFGEENNLTGTVHLLVECKYRKDGTSWLFLPDPNEPEFSPFTIGQTIRAVDNFSKNVLAPNSVVLFDENLPFCFKGVEIDLINASAYDKEIKHGLNQLHYALPSLLVSEINSSTWASIDPGRPFFICPILLTTAPIYLAKDSFSVDLVKASSELIEIADRVPYLITYQDVSPDFIQHCIREFSDKLVFDVEHLNDLGSYRLSKGEFEHLLPLNIIESLISGRLSALKSYFTQYIVCDWQHFPELIDNLKKSISFAMSGVEK